MPMSTPLTKVAAGMDKRDEAEELGYRHGRDALTNCNPYEAGSELDELYLRGWDTGYDEYSDDRVLPG